GLLDRQRVSAGREFGEAVEALAARRDLLRLSRPVVFKRDGRVGDDRARGVFDRALYGGAELRARFGGEAEKEERARGGAQESRKFLPHRKTSLCPVSVRPRRARPRSANPQEEGRAGAKDVFGRGGRLGRPDSNGGGRGRDASEPPGEIRI